MQLVLVSCIRGMARMSNQGRACLPELTYQVAVCYSITSTVNIKVPLLLPGLVRPNGVVLARTVPAGWSSRNPRRYRMSTPNQVRTLPNTSSSVELDGSWLGVASSSAN